MDDKKRSFIREITDDHRREDPGTVRVFHYDAPNEIRLLEVTGSVPSGGEIMPVTFSPASSEGLQYPLTIVLVSPDDYEAIKNNVISLPEGWTDPEEIHGEGDDDGQP